ncbi:uncharacterized protein EV420DRAFT_1488276 [Desarmillaria tabescens]|uniref:Uncharacterized protein n=1 Tax=Armillaria tabescens TaxID=1929756 RepID=A0AA39J492_ARMTA|nr:uncharacterized protein EV420DRAFT_1488276 [Desarmillaria tabescens]KAK0434996.1 hypothetical protein EV420DRAFT_1488276 [Desarmillaria tabescens]
MDRFYNKDDTKNIVELLTQERVKKNRMHLSRVLKDNEFVKPASIKRDDEAGVWRIIKQSEDEGTMEEMVFTITGAIYAMDLPLVAKETRAQKEKVGFLSQLCNSTNNKEGIPFSNDVDLAGILAKIAQQKWIHTEDNEIRVDEVADIPSRRHSGSAMLDGVLEDK